MEKTFIKEDIDKLREHILQINEIVKAKFPCYKVVFYTRNKELVMEILERIA